MGPFAEDAIAIPLTEDRQLVQLQQQTIPGHPDIAIDNSAALSTARLRRLYPMLFMVSNRRNISPLHHQLLNGRSICITERPDLHLVWYYNRIFVKPVPKPLFSYHFWRDAVREAEDTDGHRLVLDALGFLRTYSMLIVHESDFNLAGFTPLRDQAVSRRYHYGEIRLTRLNLFHRIMTMSSYQKVHHNYATFFARFGAPYLFVFGAATVVLTALQTGLDAFPDHGTYIQIIAKFVPFTLFITAAGISLLPLLCLFFWARELVRFIFCHRHPS
ncbi:hypothetical protein CSHISOI_09309 [Colletotrichum shisoi]|uniref:Uncharacterized protein n=1 Tax=Colletotrichum shisoi TaxID=2078593 RepID=A0A5Q4BGS3_9PEZI|nr:hypothetical protein CSHISOI_09309 [Colletotrichum shisoi]